MLKLIKNAMIFAPEKRGICNLLIADARILWIGTSEPKLAQELHAETLDAEGRTLVPGFIDIHAHVTGGGGESGYASRVPPVSLERFTSGGTSTVVGLLGTDDTTRDTKGLLAQTRALRAQGLNAYCYTGGYHIPPVTLTGCVRSDIVNLDAVVGVGEIAISDHRSSQPTLDELLRVASDAHVAGMMTGKAGILHLHLGDGERGLDLVRRSLQVSELPARVFNPTHINRRKALFEEACDLAKLGCYVDITAFPVADGEDAWSAPDALLRYLQTDAPEDQVTISSDGGGCLPQFDQDGRIVHMDIGDPGSLGAVLKQLLDQNCPMQTALPAITANPADLMRLNRKGRIAPGLDADLVLLADDHSVDSVMIGGQWHRKNGVQLIQDYFTK